MRKWQILAVFLASVGMLFATSIGDGSGSPAEEIVSSSSDDGGGIDEPFEAMADTTADIYIYVTLRQPEGPPAPDFYIFQTNCAVSSENVEFKATIGPGDRDDCDFYLLYRAPWALFEWNDIWMLADPPAQRDTATMIDPIEFPFGFTDAGMYRWGWKEADFPGSPDSHWVGGVTSYDYFLDSLIGATDSRGVCDPDTNWIYTAVAVDTNETDGRLLFSPTPARPVGEFDQWFYEGTNILSYPVDIGCLTAAEIGEVIDTIDGVPCARDIWQWNAPSQSWVRVAYITPFGFWSGADALLPGDIFRSDKIDPGTVLWSTSSPGYIPFDSEIPNHDLVTPGALPSADNFVVMPFQEYNILLSGNWSSESIDFVRGKDMLQDIPCAKEIWIWSGGTQTWVRVAYYFGTMPAGNDPIFPGLPYRVITDGDCIWPPL